VEKRIKRIGVKGRKRGRRIKEKLSKGRARAKQRSQVVPTTCILSRIVHTQREARCRQNASGRKAVPQIFGGGNKGLGGGSGKKDIRLCRGG